MLDTRQYRDDQLCGDGWRACPDALDPARSILGEDQEEWLIDGFHRSGARWDILGQQVFFAQQDRDRGPGKVTSQDAWDGYVASRQRITQGWRRWPGGTADGGRSFATMSPPAQPRGSMPASATRWCSPVTCTGAGRVT